MKKFLKIIALVMLLIFTMVVFSGCTENNEKTPNSSAEIDLLVEALEKGDYTTAYKEAKSNDEKNMVKYENTFAYMGQALNKMVENGDYETSDIEILDAWADGHKSDDITKVRYAIKFKLTLEEDTGLIYCYRVFDKEIQSFVQDTLIEANVAESFNDMDTEEQMSLTYDENNACYNINLMIDDTEGEFAYKMQEESIKRLNKLFDNKTVNNIGLSDELLKALSE